MSHYIEETNQWLYEISYILHKPKFVSRNYELGVWFDHRKMQQSKTLGWLCSLCGSRSTPSKQMRYKHTLLQRVKWHLERCPAEKEKKEMELVVLYD